MNPLIRWGKFNLVGAMGMVVQLGALAAINRLRTRTLPLRHGRGDRADVAA